MVGLSHAAGSLNFGTRGESADVTQGTKKDQRGHGKVRPVVTLDSVLHIQSSLIITKENLGSN